MTQLHRCCLQTMLIPNANSKAFGAQGLGVTSLDISYHPFSLISSMPHSFHWLLSAKLIQEAPCMHVPKEVYRKKSHPLPSHSTPQVGGVHGLGPATSIINFKKCIYPGGLSETFQ